MNKSEFDPSLNQSDEVLASNLELFRSLSDKHNKHKILNQILISSYSLIIIVSLIGNLMVCKVMFGKRRPLSKTNGLIINLAISDLLMTVLNIPFNIVRFVSNNWPFGAVMCVLVPFSQSVSVHTSSITMMFIAIERYKTTVLSQHFNQRSFRMRYSPFISTVVCIWFLAIVFSIPHGIFNKLVYSKLLCITRCRVEYPEPKQEFRQKITLFTLFSQYLIPILITIVSYLRICLFLWRRRIVGSVSEDRREFMNRRKLRRIKMLIIVVLVFAICWLPLNIYHILSDYKVIEYSSLLFFSTHWFAISSIW